MRVLISGCNGFVARNLIDFFYNLEIEVIGITRKETHNPKIKRQILLDLLAHNDSEDSVIKDISKMGIDVFIHTAASLDRTLGLDELMSINASLSLQYLNIARASGISRFVYTSTVAVIGEPVSSPINELHSVNPIDAYSKSKLEGEKLLLDNFTGGLLLYILRLPSPVGRYYPRNRLISRTIESIQNGEDPEIYLYGNRRQSYLDIRDLGRLILLLIKSSNSGLYFVPGKDQLSNQEVLNKIISLTNPSKRIRFSSVLDECDGQDWSISGGKLLNELGFIPNHGLEDTISNLWER